MKPINVTDHEVHEAARLLRQHPSGIRRAEFENALGGDRRARKIIAELASRGIACVINVEEVGFGNVYRVARTEEERDAEVRRLDAYIGSLERRRDGVKRAPIGSAREPQKALF